MSLTAYAEKAMDALVKSAKDLREEVVSDVNELVFPPPSDEPLLWERDGRTKGVLTLEVPKMAAQLYMGFIAQRIIPAVMANNLRRVLDLGENFVSKKVADAALGKAAKSATVIRFLVDALEIWEETKEQLKIHAVITGKSLDYQREMLDLKPNKQKKTGIKKRCKVYSRNYTPKQRPPNATWRDTKN